MKNKFKAGDFARRKSDGKILKINMAEYGRVAYDEEFLMMGACPMEEVELVDPKTTFLSELKGLLEKYNAQITIGLRTEDRTIGVAIRVDEGVLYYPFDVKEMDNDPSVVYQFPQTNYPLTSNNIMDYDKE